MSHCTCCGETHRWASLAPCGLQYDGESELLELRNCPCGTTRAAEVTVGNASEVLWRWVRDSATRRLRISIRNGIAIVSASTPAVAVIYPSQHSVDAAAYAALVALAQQRRERLAA